MFRTRVRQALTAFLAVVALVAGIIAFVATSHTPTAPAPARAAPADRDADHGEDADQGEEGEDDGGPAAPAEYLTAKYTSGQDVTLQQVRQAQAQAQALPSTDQQWGLLGPTNIGGRVTGLVVDPRRTDTLYVAASGGGIWKSTDAGDTFSPAWPSKLTQTIGAIAMASDGTLWVGTGEANPSGGGLTFFGTGVYRSSDGGATWTNAGLRDSGAVGSIVVDPSDPGRVFVAASGNLSGTATQRGVYRLNGTTWQHVLPTPNDTTGAVDLAIDPANPDRVYATLWDHHRNSGARVYGGVGSGLFRSDDGGATWHRLQHVIGTASTDESGTGLRPSKTLGRIGVAVAPNDPDRVYVISGTQYGADKGFYVSDDAGTTLRPSGHAGGSSGYSWWFGKVWVDPSDENHVFVADVGLRESDDGGASWHYSNGVHADQHALQWDPTQPGRIYLGNDGGVYHSTQNGATGSWIHATYEPFNQSYHLAVATDDPKRLATGLQDNGSVRTWTATHEPTDLSQWNAYGGGDGHEVLIDYRDHDIYYECYQVGNCTRHEDVGNHTTSHSFGELHSERTTTDAPLILDPTNPNVVYTAGNVLDRSTDRGNTFTQISPDGNYLTGPVPPNENDQGPFYGNEYATITWIAPAKTRSNTIWVGTDTGRLWRTDDLGGHWKRINDTALPTRWVNAIIVDPNDADHVYVAYSGYREGYLAANVFETTDNGASWTNISGALPNAPVEMLTYDPFRHMLYAATDLGVFVLNRGQGWARVGSNLPNTPILDVKISADRTTLFVATFGRSVWAVPTGVS